MVPLAGVRSKGESGAISAASPDQVTFSQGRSETGPSVDVNWTAAAPTSPIRASESASEPCSMARWIRMLTSKVIQSPRAEGSTSERWGSRSALSSPSRSVQAFVPS